MSTVPGSSAEDDEHRKMRILQLNLNHCEAAQELLKQTVREQKIDLTILSEHYRAPDNQRWATSKCNKAAIWSCGKFPVGNVDNRREGFVKCTVNGVHFFSCYLPPSLSMEEYRLRLDDIVREARNLRPVVIAGDFNAWAVEWGSAYTNQRGESLLDAFATLEVVLLNCGQIDTFSRNGRSSKIDLTFISDTLATTSNWTVSDVYTHSDHRAIIFDIQERAAVNPITAAPPNPLWRDSTFDEETFVLAMSDIRVTGSANNMAVELMRCITEACSASMSRKSHLPGRKHVYWWNAEIAELRRKCNRARRIFQRARGRNDFIELRERYKVLRANLNWAIDRSKRRCYREMCADLDENPWGTGYKVVMRKLNCFRPPATESAEKLQSIVEGLFPERAEITYAVRDSMSHDDIPEVSGQEFDAVWKEMKLRKAPGIDGIPNVALKVAIENNVEVFRKVFDTCIQERKFPRIWKRQRLVLIPKGNGAQDATGYRPLCMIDTVGKLLEKIICRRLETILERDGLSDRQFGFRKGRSTVDAMEAVITVAKEAISGDRWFEGDKEYCAIITLDVKNAFNSADWDATLAALDERSVPGYLMELIVDYFKDRVLLYDTDEGRKSYAITAGVPQGSVLGPILWNAMYDGVLRLRLPTGAQIFGFADDIALVVRGKHLDNLERTSNAAVSRVRSWIASIGLKLADHKTDVVLVSSRKKMEYITITVGEQRITSKQSIKYLGVMIDNRLTFKEHLTYISRKCAAATGALARIMPNLGGPRQEKRQLLMRVVRSIALYAAPIWAEAMDKKTYRIGVDGAYRRSALRVISAFRTVSTDAALVIAGMMPLRMLVEIERRKRLISRRTGLVHPDQVNDDVMNRWQHEWTSSTKGRWTYRLIPNIEEWTGRKHGQVNFYLTQFLTGHGCYRTYLYKYGHDVDEACPSCLDTSETAEHIFFTCPRYEFRRNFLERTIGSQVTPDNVVNLMLTSRENWNAVCLFAKEVLVQQRIIERARTAEMDSSTR